MDDNFDDIQERIIELIIENLGVTGKIVTPSASFTEDLIDDLEKEFGIDIPPEDAEIITTVRDATEYISGIKDDPGYPSF